MTDLKQYAELTIVAAVCDGAGSNRLFQKMNTSELRRGSLNLFIKVRLPPYPKTAETVLEHSDWPQAVR